MADIQTAAIGAQTLAGTTGSPSILGKDDFLKLLITQLRYQDPLEPMKGTEFAAQLAQFSSVEQLSNINTNLTQTLATNQLMTQSIGNSLAATMIGKGVKASANEFQFTGTGSAQLGYTLPVAAAEVSVRVYDSTGTLVRTITNAGTDKGDSTVVWDGTNDSGQTMAEGKYTFKVDAQDSSKAALTATPFLYGTISAVRFTSAGTMFVVDGVEIPVSQILELLNGKGNG
jgi:flagellar basal-body rod modification protein FlgD